MADLPFPQGGSLSQQRQSKVIDDPKSKESQQRAIENTQRAVDSAQARVTRRMAAARNPVNQPGSLVLSHASPSQLPDRRNAQSTMDAPIDVYANPPPVGNQYNARMAGAYAASPPEYVHPQNKSAAGNAIRARNQHREEVIARGTQKPLSARDQAIRQGRTPAAEPNYDALFMTPAEIAERDYNQRDQENYRIEQKYGAEFSEQRRPPTTASESGAGRFPRGNAKVPEFLDPVKTGINTPHNAPGGAIPKPFEPYQYTAQPRKENENWRKDVLEAYPRIGIAGSKENAAFVEAFKLHGDPNLAMQTANRLHGVYTEPPEEDIMDLISNPNLANDFDAAYGPGSASKYLPIPKN